MHILKVGVFWISGKSHFVELVLADVSLSYWLSWSGITISALTNTEILDKSILGSCYVSVTPKNIFLGFWCFQRSNKRNNDVKVSTQAEKTGKRIVCSILAGKARKTNYHWRLIRNFVLKKEY